MQPCNYVRGKGGGGKGGDNNYAALQLCEG